MASASDPQYLHVAPLMTAEEERQLARFNELMYDQGDKREFQVRVMAAQAVGHPATYKFGMSFPYLPTTYTAMDPKADPPADVPYKVINVRLIPSLRNYMKAAQIIAEEQIREQIKSFHDTATATAESS